CPEKRYAQRRAAHSQGRSQSDLGLAQGAQSTLARRGDGAADRQDVENQIERGLPRVDAENELNGDSFTRSFDGDHDYSETERLVPCGWRRCEAGRLEWERGSNRQAAVCAVPRRRFDQ